MSRPKNHPSNKSKPAEEPLDKLLKTLAYVSTGCLALEGTDRVDLEHAHTRIKGATVLQKERIRENFTNLNDLLDKIDTEVMGWEESENQDDIIENINIAIQDFCTCLDEILEEEDE